MTKARNLADLVSGSNALADGIIEISEISGLTASATELNYCEGVTSSIQDQLDNTSSSLGDLGVSASISELDNTIGTTSAIQGQIDSKAEIVTIAVTVAPSSGNKFFFDGVASQSGSSTLKLTPSVTYRFDQSDSSNLTHPLRFSNTEDGTHNSGVALTTGITYVGTPGTAGSYVEYKVPQKQENTIYAYCANHSGMGEAISIGGKTYNFATPLTEASNGTVSLLTDQRWTSISTNDAYYGIQSEAYVHFAGGSSDTIYWFCGTLNEMRLDASNGLHVDGNITAFSSSILSDINYKYDVKNIENALDKISKINGVTFRWKDDNSSSGGVIAQEVEAVLPVAVTESNDLNSNEKRKTVNYNAVIGLLIESIKELKEEIEILKKGC